MTAETATFFEAPRLTPAEVRDLFVGSSRVAASAKGLELHQIRFEIAEAKLALEAEKQQHRQTAHALLRLQMQLELNAMTNSHIELCAGYEKLSAGLNTKYGIELGHSAVDDMTGEVRRLPGSPEPFSVPTVFAPEQATGPTPGAASWTTPEEPPVVPSAPAPKKRATRKRRT